MGEGAGISRLNRVHVATGGGALELPWESRDKLLDRLADHDALKGVREAFEAVGATRPVQLGQSDIPLLIRTIDDWAHYTGAPRLPTGIWALRNALAADLDKDPDDS
jgi:hypothetical protein